MSLLALLNFKNTTYNTPNDISETILEDVCKDEPDIYGILGWIKVKPEFALNPNNNFQQWCYDIVNRLAVYFKQKEYTQSDINIFSFYVFSLYISIDEQNSKYFPLLQSMLALKPSKNYNSAWLCQEEIRLLYLQLLNLHFEEYSEEINTQLEIANANMEKVKEVRENEI